MNRRHFLVAGAAAAAMPGRALGQVAATGEVDVAIVGAGAAGLAAARRVAEHGRTYALLEALDRAGGRAQTDAATFGVPFDLGADRLWGPRRNPLVGVARANGLDATTALRLQRVRIGSRDARDADTEDFASALSRANRAIVTAGEQRTDIAAGRAVPDIGDWLPTVSFLLGPAFSSKDLDEVSAADYARAEERDEEAFCRQGVGAILALAAVPLAIQHSTPVTEIDWSGRLIALATPRGTIRARTVVLTVSTAVLAGGAIRFKPGLPPAIASACQRLTLGSYNRIGIELAGNPLRLRDDERVVFKVPGPAAMTLRGRVGGTDLAVASIGGRAGRELEQAGAAAMVAFATDTLAAHYGAGIRKAIGRTFATRWGLEPTILGAGSAAPPGAQPMRRALAQPIDNRLFLAGEATHETQWGTIGGAWLSGERAADQALRAVGVAIPLPASPAPLAPAKPGRTPKRRQPRRDDVPRRN
ncbi:amine oxidase [Blastochloris tepida]|uniref:Tryptophan 2-monooxygenase n=2 Tax=Blastochloris tepida TaxID=2233851 RepID=A0A348G3J4_9HYPH|nr:amine oxidase [Blastochloris tepida]